MQEIYFNLYETDVKTIEEAKESIGKQINIKSIKIYLELFIYAPSVFALGTFVEVLAGICRHFHLFNVFTIWTSKICVCYHFFTHTILEHLR